MNNIKKIVILVIAVALLGLTGTFAWVNFHQSMANEFTGTVNNGGTTHDDFCKPKKDVYVENWGSSILYVRIRLDEYMELGQGAGKYFGALNGARTADPTNLATSLINGATITDLSTWTPHVPDVGSPATCTTEANFHKYWQWEMGGSKWFMPVDQTVAAADPSYVASDNGVYDQNTPGAHQTLDATVMTMADWMAQGSPIGNYWVIDTDGWAYWAAPLASGTATGLLLSAVNPLQAPDEDYYYGINVVTQMATKDGDENYTDFFSGVDADHSATSDGQALLNKIVSYQPVSGVTVSAPEGTTQGSVITVPAGTLVHLTAAVTLTSDGSAAGASTNVVWTSATTPGFALNMSGPNAATVQVDSGLVSGTSFTVKAAAAADQSQFATTTIRVQ